MQPARTSSTTHRHWQARLALALSLVTGASAIAAAQTPHPWTFEVTPYAWMAGLGGQVGVRNVAADVDLGFDDILHHLNFGAMATLEARKGRLVLGADVIYISLGGSSAFAFRGASGDVALDQREAIIQPVVGYTFSRKGWSLDVLAGARYWNLSTDLGVDPARLASRNRSGTKDWLDATGGLRGRGTITNNFSVTAEADGGGGGSRGSWQAVGALNYAVAKHYEIMAGYRYLDVNYDRDDFLYDTHTNGWLLGVRIQF